MATASTGWIIFQFSIRAHETLPLATFWFYRVYHENQSTEHFMSPTASKRKTSGCLQKLLISITGLKAGQSFMFCYISGAVRSQGQPLHFFVLPLFFSDHHLSPYFNIQLKKREVTTQKCSIAHLGGYSNFQCCQ